MLTIKFYRSNKLIKSIILRDKQYSYIIINNLKIKYNANKILIKICD